MSNYEAHIYDTQSLAHSLFRDAISQADEYGRYPVFGMFERMLIMAS